jgi:hypothetical protein
MSRVIAYRRFIAVRLENDGGQPTAAFDIQPTAATRQRLSLHRLLARPQRDGLALYYQTNPQSVPPLLGEITARRRFSFTLHLREPDFFKRHHPDLTEATGAGLQLDNLDGAGAVLSDGARLSAGATVAAADAVDIGRRNFALLVDLTASAPTAVEAREAVSAALVQSAAITAPAGAAAASVALDLSLSSDVLFRVAEVPPGPLDRRAYADDGVASAGAAGVIDLYWETAQSAVPDPAGVVYRAVFQRR